MSTEPSAFQRKFDQSCSLCHHSRRERQRPFSFEGDEEDAVEFGLKAGWNNDEGSPPASDSLLRGHGEDLVSKLNVLLGLGYVLPVVENGLPAAHRLDERRDLIGAVFRE